MKPPEEVKREFVRQWLAKAGADLRASRHLLNGGLEFAASGAFHAEQAVEKALAQLVWDEVLARLPGEFRSARGAE